MEEYVSETGHTVEVGRHLGKVLHLNEAELLIKGNEAGFAGEPEGWWVNGQQMSDESGSDALIAPGWNDGDRGQFTRAIAVRFDLSTADNLAVGRFSQDKL